MSFIRFPGKTFCRHASVLRTCRRLQHVEKVEADRLLNLYGATLGAVFADVLDSNIAAAPEIVHVLLLSSEQLLESLRRYPVHCPLSAAAEFLSRSGARGVIDHVFGEYDRTVRPGLDDEGDLAEIIGVDGLVGIRARCLQCMVGGTCHGQAALFGRMTQHDATAFGITGPRM